MPIKTTLYGKTRRVGAIKQHSVVTEKLDGSNIAFFKYGGALHVAQRNNIFSLAEVLEGHDGLYRGLRGWLHDCGENLQAELHNEACVIGEWIGMGKIGYAGEFQRFCQFAKSNVKPTNGVIGMKNVYYDHDLFKWSYFSQDQPEYIQSVPVVEEYDKPPGKFELDLLYDGYTTDLERKCEGFVINTNNTVTKYVRYKNGNLTDHKS